MRTLMMRDHKAVGSRRRYSGLYHTLAGRGLPVTIGYVLGHDVWYSQLPEAYLHYETVKKMILHPTAALQVDTGKVCLLRE